MTMMALAVVMMRMMMMTMLTTTTMWKVVVTADHQRGRRPFWRAAFVAYLGFVAAAARPAAAVPTGGQNVLLNASSFDLVANSFSGSIWINNIAYTKIVNVVYSNPTATSWPISSYINASYSAASTGGYEVWTFSSPGTTSLAPGSQFYLKYIVSGSTYYDNNNSKNYVVSGIWSWSPNPSAPTDSSAVKLKNVTLAQNGTSSLNGTIWINNIAPTKTVQVCFTNSTSSTTLSCASASYGVAASGSYETWTFSFSNSALAVGSKFYISYQVSGSTYLDGTYNLGSTAISALTTSTTSTTAAATSPSTSSSSASASATSTSSSATAGAVTSYTPHPEGPSVYSAPALMQSYSYDPASNTLSGTVYVRTADSSASGYTLYVYYSNSSGIFESSAPYLSATYSTSSSFSGYDIWSFSGNPIRGGTGMHMYIRSGTSSSYSYSTNGGDWYHYRVFPQKRVFDSPSAWKGRAIYQLLTDRFARPLSVGSGSLYSNCTDTTTYCGGTWQGVIEQLQYIANMGFDAIWISPIVSNTATGYHGYYAYDHSKLNDKFGTSTDLQNLLAAAHSLNISVMYDIVANHMGPTATGSMSYYPSPLNKDSNYHSPVCTIDYNKTPINQTEYEVCRINSVNPDINTEDPETIKWLTDSYKNHFSSYGPDGLRVDTFKHVNVTFWKSFLGNLSLFSMGEVLDGNTAYVASYQKVANSVLNYPLYYNVIQPVFGSKNSMTRITDQLSNNNQFVDSTVLGNFVDNHDINRILTTTGGDTALARNALILSLFTDGIPIVYQGFEQAYTDSSSTRLPIWPTKFKTLPSLGFYQYLSIFLRVRRDYGGQAFVDARHTALATGASYHAFQRGPFLVVLTNVGAAGANVAVSVPTAQSFGRRTLRNVLIPSDVVSPDASGVYNVTLVAGEPKVYM